MLFREQKNTLETKETVDIIEKIVYEKLKPMGFRKFGRTLHRFVDGDISQVINFQSGMPLKGMGGLMWVNTGICVPECEKRIFQASNELKKHYHEYECNIRSSLGTVSGNSETTYDLKKIPKKTAAVILEEIETVVIPVFNILNSRESILKHRRDFPLFDSINRHLIPLDESLIYGHMGNMEKAKTCFEQYYQNAIADYRNKIENGTQYYLRKGQSIVFGGHEIIAEEDGFYTVYGASDGHIRYLDELAQKLGIR